MGLCACIHGTWDPEVALVKSDNILANETSAKQSTRPNNVHDPEAEFSELMRSVKGLPNNLLVKSLFNLGSSSGGSWDLSCLQTARRPACSN
jgi:hypothetical protein